MLRSFSNLAREQNYRLIVPLFDRVNFSNYQRLGGEPKGFRADCALNKILSLVYGRSIYRVNLFGFSGGAQFTHRYALAHSARVKSITIASAGWYTNLNSVEKFPIGIKSTCSFSDLVFDYQAFLKCPSYVIVGDRDTACKKNLRSKKNINSVQGTTRLDRAIWFHQSIKDLCLRNNISTIHKFDILKNTSHEFGQADIRSNLVEKVIRFCNEVAND